jgi:hypothetical protein
MKILYLTAACAAAFSLSACAGLAMPGAGGQNFDVNKFLTDPSCAHHDEISGVTGAAGVPASLQFKASRDCPGVAQAPAKP